METRINLGVALRRPGPPLSAPMFLEAALPVLSYLSPAPSQLPSGQECQCSLLFLALRCIAFPCQFPLTLPTSLQRVPSVDMTVTFTRQLDWATGAQTFGQSFLWVCL